MIARRHCEAVTSRGYGCSRLATSAFSVEAEWSGRKTTITEFYCTYHGIQWAEIYRRRGYPDMRALGHPRVVAAFGPPKMTPTSEEAA